MATFKIDITLKNSFTPDFISLIPSQRKCVDELMNEGVIISYALALDRSRLWVVMESKSEEHVMDVLAKFPLIKFMDPQINELAFYDSIHNGFPQLSLN